LLVDGSVDNVENINFTGWNEPTQNLIMICLKDFKNLNVNI